MNCPLPHCPTTCPGLPLPPGALIFKVTLLSTPTKQLSGSTQVLRGLMNSIALPTITKSPHGIRPPKVTPQSTSSVPRHHTKVLTKQHTVLNRILFTKRHHHLCHLTNLPVAVPLGLTFAASITHILTHALHPVTRTTLFIRILTWHTNPLSV